MSPLRNALAEYLTIRRSLGYQLYSQELLLNDFLAFLEQAGADRITIELAVRWARLPQHAKPIWWARRLGVGYGQDKPEKSIRTSGRRYLSTGSRSSARVRSSALGLV